MTEIEFRKRDPFSGPAWRWDWANEIVHTPRLRCKCTDAMVLEAGAFLASRPRSPVPGQHEQHWNQFPHISIAHGI